MTLMTSPTRMLTVLLGVALSLVYTPLYTSRHPTHIPPNTGILIHSPVVAAVLFAVLAAQPASAYTIPQSFGVRIQRRNLEVLERRYTPDCTDSESITSTVAGSIVGTVAGSNANTLEPVTVTVTVGLPTSTYPAPSYGASSSSYGSTVTNGTVAFGSTGSQASSTATRTSTSNTPVSTVDPLLASAQEAQRLNLAFQSLRASDACTVGERACISNQIAQCTTLSSSGSNTPQWVTQFCVIRAEDTNQTPVCAAVPENSTSTTTTGTSNSTTAVRLGCFLPSELTLIFENAGVQGGMLPPGTQTSAAARGRGSRTGTGRASGEVGIGMGMGMLVALIANIML